MVAGYPAALRVKRQTEAGELLGVFLRIHMPSRSTNLKSAFPAGIGLEVGVTLTPNVKRSYSHYFSKATDLVWGYPDAFNKPWAEAVREGSPHFPNGKLEVKATVKLAVKRMEEESESDEE